MYICLNWILCAKQRVQRGLSDNGGVTRDICKMVDQNNLTEVGTKKKGYC